MFRWFLMTHLLEQIGDEPHVLFRGRRRSLSDKGEQLKDEKPEHVLVFHVQRDRKCNNP